jgi:gluconokinase
MKLVFMGVSGSGKTTLAGRVANHLGVSRVIEADEFHTPEMKNKMGAGIPLTDEDRWPWLARLNLAMRESNEPWSVVTCSALRKVYRSRLVEGLEGSVHFIFLDAPKEIIRERMLQRQHEYMPVSLLDSQCNTLEIPDSDEPVARISVAGSEDETLQAIIRAVNELQNTKSYPPLSESSTT